MTPKLLRTKGWTVWAPLLLVGAGACASAEASDFYGAFTYQMSLPMGTTQDYISAVSFRGAGLDLRVMQSPRVSLGALFAWNVFYEVTNRPLTLDTGKGSPGAISGTQNRLVNAFPMMAGAHYYLGEGGDGARPYLGLNAGGFVVKQTLEMGLSSIQDTVWEWGVAPEAGLILNLRGESAVLLNVRYNHAFTGEDRLGGDFNLSYWGFNAGIVWRAE